MHQKLATLITGADRLMLAIGEKLAEDQGLTWAFCDTDSLAFAKPEGMAEEECIAACQSIIEWFERLNPYVFQGSILKIEDANYRVVDGKKTGELEPLYCWAIAAKRYALFNLDTDGKPVLRKASAHGLGHLYPPYDGKATPNSVPAPIIAEDNLGVSWWQHDVWYRIVEAALHGKPDVVKLDDLPGINRPAVSRYAATTLKLLRWYRAYNQRRAYREQVRPFGFLLAFHPRNAISIGERRETIQVGKVQKRRSKRKPRREDVPRAVAPYNKDHEAAAKQTFDRNSGKAVDVRRLQTYRQALTHYHLHPESKFGNGRAFDRGVLTRRHIVASGVRHIGKEANRWEEQFHLGHDPEAQTEYCTEKTGTDRHDQQRVQHVLDAVRELRGEMSLRQIAMEAGVQYTHLSEVLGGKRKPSEAMLSILEAWLTGPETA